MRVIEKEKNKITIKTENEEEENMFQILLELDDEEFDKLFSGVLEDFKNETRSK